jgi:solute carrier family 12 (sodium/potassium/chloride transporter), member 2
MWRDWIARYMSIAAKPGAAEPRKFGAFQGVFNPSLLTILGVIMYLRFGWVLGNVGLAKTLLIVLMSCAITFLTSLSLSALATNMKVGSGGAYYIISRSLGMEAGAAVGIPLFIAQALGVAFYIAGFTESITALFPMLSTHVVAIVTLTALIALAYTSANLVLRTQLLIFVLIIASLVSFFFGSGEGLTLVEGVVPPERESFWIVFAVFFPAVTGIEAGLALSGELAHPEKALPRGTLGAVLVSTIVYIAIPIFLSRIIVEHDLLITNLMIFRDVAYFGGIIMAGLWGAALSSALGAILGASRTLQALAKDRIVLSLLAKGSGVANEPRIATGVTAGIALVGIVAGDLNLIAPVLSMFFLTSYGLLNLSAAFEGLIGNPSWRPTIHIPWYISFVGFLGCLCVMLMINAGATLIAIFLSLLIYYSIKRRGLQAHWGDMRYGVLNLVSQLAIYKMARKKPDGKTWRPNILVLSGSPASRWYLIALADAISHGKGFLTIAAIVPEALNAGEKEEKLERTIQEYLEKRNVPALVKIFSAPNLWNGAQVLIKAYGFGPLEPNTILLGESEQTADNIHYAEMIQTIHSQQKNLIVMREGEDAPEMNYGGQIDIWLSQHKANAGLMMALAYMLRTSSEWEKSQLCLRTIVESEARVEDVEMGLHQFLKGSRIACAVSAIVKTDEDVFSLIEKHSRKADIVFIGLRHPEANESPEAYGAYYGDFMKKIQHLPPTAIILAAEDIEFHKIFV